MHSPDGVRDRLPLGYEDGRFAVSAAAAGEDSVDEGFAGVSGDGGVEAEHFYWLLLVGEHTYR